MKTITTICVALLSGLAISFANPPKVETLEIGAEAPAFKLMGVDDKEYTLDSFKDYKYLMVVFTCNHCPDARATWGRLNTFAAEYEEKGVKVVAISSNAPEALMLWENGYSEFGDSFPEMKQVSERRKFVFPYLYDGDTQVVAKAYGAQATPHTFLFGPERKLLYQGQFDNGRRDPGPPSSNTAKDNVDALLAGKTIEKPVMRTFGCSTKWAWKKEWVAKKQKEWEALEVTVEPIDATAVKELASNKTDKVRVINVWSTTCGPCVAEFPDLIDTYRRYHKRPFDLITISIDAKKDAEAVKKFLVRQHLPVAPDTVKGMKKEGRTTNNYHYQSDDLDALAEALDAKWQGPIPHTIVIAPNGKITFSHTGAFDPVALREAIVKTIEGMSVAKK